MNTDQLVDELWNGNIVQCLDAIKEADEALETINRDMFTDIATCAAKVVNNGGDSNKVKNVLKNFEKKYKKERSVQHMPGSYRSAKSVVLSAVRVGVPLYKDEEPKGKTALEREIREEKKRHSAAETRGRPSRIDELVGEAYGCLASCAPAKLGESDDPKRLEANLDFIEKRVQEIRDLYL